MADPGYSVLAFYDRIRHSLWQAGIMYLVVVMTFLSLFYGFIRISIDREINTLNLVFQDRLNSIERIMRHARVAPQEYYQSLYRVDLQGKVIEATPRWFTDENIGDSGLFQKIASLKPDQIFITFYPDFSDFSRRLYFVVRLQDSFLLSTYEPEIFFPHTDAETRIHITDAQHVCLYSTVPELVGDIIRQSDFHFQGGQIYFSRSGSLAKTERLSLIIEQNVTGAVMAILLVLLSSLLFFALLIRRILRLRRELHTLSSEFTSLTDHIKKLSEGMYADVSSRGFAFHELDAMYREFQTMANRILAREEELKKTEKKYRDIFENAVEGIFQSTVEGRYLSVNPAQAEMLGYGSAEELLAGVADIGRDVYADKEENDRFVELVLTHDSIMGFEALFKQRDGGEIWVSSSARAVRNDQGEVLYIEGFNVDISAQKSAEIESRRLENELRQSQKLESIGQLAGGVAHDLNNLLTPILGYSEMLKDVEEIDSGYRRHIKEISKAAKRSRILIRQLLAFGRKQILEMQNCNFNDLVADFKGLLRSSIRENIQIQTHLADDLDAVIADLHQMEQVLLNLAVNAQDAMPDGGILTIETANVEFSHEYAMNHPEVIPGSYVMLAVSDTGTGIDPDIIEHIFEPFYTTKSLGKGTGLGLATVYGIVTQQRGNIMVYSEPGEGTIFKIYFPSAGRRRRNLKISTENVGELSGHETIAVTEDNPLVLDLATDVLERLGYTVITAPDAESCLEKLEGGVQSVDLLLTDLIMPGLNGKELYAELRKNHPRLKVVYMSGYTENLLARDEIGRKGIHFIQKPFSNKHLAAQIRKALDEQLP